MDGNPLTVAYEGITWHDKPGEERWGPPDWGDVALAEWTAAAGSHTVVGFWTDYPNAGQSCTFSVGRR